MFTFKEIFFYIKEYGVKKSISILSRISWYLSPIILWWYILLEREFYLIQNYWVIVPGLIFLLVLAFWLVVLFFKLINYDERIRINVNQANETFNNPDDNEAEEIFRKECDQFVIPYVYLVDAARTSVIHALNKLGLKRCVFESLVNAYTTFSVFMFAYKYKLKILNIILSFLDYIKCSKYVVSIFTSHFNITLFIMFSLSILELSSLKIIEYTYKDNNVNLICVIWSALNEWLFPFPTRFMIVPLIINFPFKYVIDSRRVICEPFNLSTEVPLLIQQCAKIIGLDIRITKLEYSIIDIDDIETLKLFYKRDKNTSYLFKAYIQLLNAENAMGLLSKLDPEFWLGITEKECIFHGTVLFEPSKGIRNGRFFFNNAYLQNEFEIITNKYLSELREMKDPLPRNARDFISKIDKRGELKDG